jgi:hypothetical protein
MVATKDLLRQLRAEARIYERLLECRSFQRLSAVLTNILNLLVVWLRISFRHHRLGTDVPLQRPNLVPPASFPPSVVSGHLDSGGADRRGGHGQAQTHCCPVSTAVIFSASLRTFQRRLNATNGD